MADAAWYVVGDDGDEQGPLTGEQLKALARKGEIVAETRVRRDDLRIGVPARDVAGLLPEDEPAPVPGDAEAEAREAQPAPATQAAARRATPNARVANLERARAPRIAAALVVALCTAFALACAAAGLVTSGTPAGAELTAALASAPAALTSPDPRHVAALSSLAALLFVVWFTRAYGGVARIGGHRRHGDLAPVWVWFVPVVNLWWPLRILADIRAAFGAPGGFLVACWWGLAIGSWIAMAGEPLDPRPTSESLILVGGHLALTALLVAETTGAQRRTFAQRLAEVSRAG